MSNEGRDQNANWDGIWDVGTRIGEDGWYAEIEIPFKTLKFGPEAMQTWGINFQRRLRRKNENSYWSPLRRIHQLSRVSMAGTYEGLQGLRPGANVRVKPYALANLNKLAGVSLDKDYDAGFDVKYGVTSGLTWDFTVNTDFSQVEADEQQVNLTRFNLFFPEKRDFFLENSGVFQFGSGNTGGGGGGGGGGRQNASQDMIFFFSRQIGLSPTGDAIPLLAGTRLTGRVGGWSVGALNIQQREQNLSPSTNFTALRLRRDILANSDVGVMFLNKDPNGDDYNRAFGADANFRFFRDLTVNVAGAKSATPSERLPGDGRRLVFEEQLRLSRRRAGNARRCTRRSARASTTRWASCRASASTTPRATSARTSGSRSFPSWMRETFPHFQIENFTKRNGGGLESRYMDWHWPVTFQNSTFIEVGVNPNDEVIDDRFAINSRRGIYVEPGRYEFKEYFVLANSNAAAPFSMNLRYGNGEFYDGYRRNYTVGGTFRMNEHLNVSLSDQINDIELASGAFVTHLVTGRVNYYFNTKVFVNALVQYNTDTQPVELERAARHHPPPAERHLPGLQRASRLAQRRADLARGDREDDVPARVLVTGGRLASVILQDGREDSPRARQFASCHLAILPRTIS